MTDAVEQAPPLLPALRREPRRPEREHPVPTREDAPRTGPEPHKGTLLDITVRPATAKKELTLQTALYI